MLAQLSPELYHLPKSVKYWSNSRRVQKKLFGFLRSENLCFVEPLYYTLLEGG